MSKNKPEVKVPEPQLPSRGRTSAYAGKTLAVNPRLKANPRKAGSHGARAWDILAANGPMKYEAYRDAVTADESIAGFSNHLAWDLKRHFILIVDELDEETQKALLES